MSKGQLTIEVVGTMTCGGKHPPGYAPLWKSDIDAAREKGDVTIADLEDIMDARAIDAGWGRHAVGWLCPACSARKGQGK
jgi:hypothetical protein